MGKQVILCIDDEEIILDALEEQLNNFFGTEYDIETSDSGEDALEFFRELQEENIHVPVVISDYIMPGMKGDELLKEIHKLSPGSLKILLTGQASIEGIGNAINNAQLYRFIAKPWDKDDLVLTVREAIKSFFQELQIRKQNEELKKLNSSLEEKVKLRTQELSIANASKDKFFSIIAHDLKTPFNALLGLTDALVQNWEIFDDKNKIEFIKDLNASSKNTYNLIQNLLEWSRAQTGRIVVNQTEFIPHEVVFENIGVLAKHSDSKQIEVINNVPVEIVCHGDRNMISTVFRNLISNAIKFTNQKGRIEINASENGRFWQFCISDSGIGIDAETLSKLFDITEKTQRIGTANEEGTGLGLILCKEFIIKNRGNIFVESGPGTGSKFYITLPKTN
ncbi:hybrid sensor histidine kinase/response regulator [Maribellus maritimus]|uniref:hybrid sensor histidine kinase/response regulator n=1 Tax=Maribellus maritimus TaxID=2870838 RepID=UPI001EEABE1C|nr:hybrid sensor histidine kinase/response regulator [Maribellus maritimus]MCG6190590.1 hybrid sensor histidine kinase/response regulator [Maribellus maritimus]